MVQAVGRVPRGKDTQFREGCDGGGAGGPRHLLAEAQRRWHLWAGKAAEQGCPAPRVCCPLHPMGLGLFCQDSHPEQAQGPTYWWTAHYWHCSKHGASTAWCTREGCREWGGSCSTTLHCISLKFRSSGKSCGCWELAESSSWHLENDLFSCTQIQS